MVPIMAQDGTSSPPAIWSANDLAKDPHETSDKADRVQRMFAAIAGSYDLNNRLHSFGRDQAWRRRAVAMCNVKPGDEVLDVACGTGDLTLAFAAAGAQSVIGVDFTEPMLKIAREKLLQVQSSHNPRRSGSVMRDHRASGAADDLSAPSRSRLVSDPECSDVEFRCADAMDLPYDDASFDIVSIAFGIRNVAEPMRVLREFRRVLRGGGRLMVLEFSEPHNRFLRAGHAVYCRHIMPFTATLIARDRSGAYRYLPKSVQTFASPEKLARDLREAGFDQIHQHPMTFGVCTATLATFDTEAAK